MTKSPEKGTNEIAEEAKRRAAREGKNVCDVLIAMLREAKKARDTIRQRKIVKAQKFLGCRNKRKRSS